MINNGQELKGSPQEGGPFISKNKLDLYYTFLKEVDFFKSLDSVELKLVAGTCQEESFKANEVLVQENSIANRFFIIIDGNVEVWKNWNEENPYLIGKHGPGHFFGEMALLDGQPRSATVIASENVMTLYINRENFRELINRYSSIAFSVMLSMSNLVRASNSQFVDDLRARNRELSIAYAELEKAQDIRIRDERFFTLGKFSSMMLHDIRNPLSAIKAQTELIQEFLDQPVFIKNFVSTITNEVQRLERMANEFLDFSRGEVRLNLSPIEPCELIFDLINNIKQRFDSDGIKIIKSCQAEGKSILDRDRMHRALYNICDNARKAMLDSQTKELQISAEFQDQNLIIKIGDTGRGMGKEVVEHLYEPFFSASEHGGTGLGLVVVKNVIEAHSGKLEIKTGEGRGTVFTISLPRMAIRH